MTVIEPKPVQGSSGTRRKGGGVARLLPLLLALAGVCLLLYPVVGTLWRNHNQTGQAQVYSQQITSEVTQAEREVAIESAHAWNVEHQGMPILDPWLARITADNPDYHSYLEQLNIADAMGRITIPEIQSDLPIYHGTTEDVLNMGIGHLYGSSLPVGGDGTHAILTGHTGLPGATLWDNLKDIKVGDAVYMDVAGQKMKYQVTTLEVVLPDETSKLKPEAGKDQITLITCTPYGINSHRLLVTAERVPMDEDEDVFAQTYTPWQWWMTAALALVALVLLIVLWAWLRARRKRTRAAHSADAQADNNSND
ncbi:class C sortase [Corynebacterium striatum]|uniref:class C sortase n=1 Tax=Corynebacterium striatum TaxID=43770 RepID=UPI0034D47022